jgi:hypothetical protein
LFMDAENIVEHGDGCSSWGAKARAVPTLGNG